MMSFNAQIELIKTLDATEIQLRERTYTYNFRQVRASVALRRMELMSIALRIVDGRWVDGWGVSEDRGCLNE